MIFFTRDLYNGIQPDSGWERKAMRALQRRITTYDSYLKIIAPFLPASVRRFSRHSLHDCKVKQVFFSKSLVRFTLNAQHAFSLPKPNYELTFEGITSFRGSRKLTGRWWLYDEFHLCSSAPFSFHAMFDDGEIELDASDISFVSKRP
jgi:hypothetical protein